jgi:sRNA-binding protein
MFLERYYSVYDSDAQRIGFAETIYTHQHTSERASFRKAKRAHNARAHKKQHQYVAAAAAAADVVPSPSNSTSTSSPPSTKRPAVKAKVVDVSAADGKKRRLGALKGLSPFEMVVES